MIVEMIQDLQKTMEKIQEMSTKDLEEPKNKKTEMNIALERISSRINEAEQINNLKFSSVQLLSHVQLFVTP